MIARSYLMIPAESREVDLRAALETLAGQVRSLPGAVRVDIMSDQKTPAFLFIETWDDAEAAAAGGKLLGRDAFAPIMALLAKPPESAQYDLI